MYASLGIIFNILRLCTEPLSKMWVTFLITVMSWTNPLILFQPLQFFFSECFWRRHVCSRRGTLGEWIRVQCCLNWFWTHWESYLANCLDYSQLPLDTPKSWIFNMSCPSLSGYCVVSVFPDIFGHSSCCFHWCDCTKTTCLWGFLWE